MTEESLNRKFEKLDIAGRKWLDPRGKWLSILDCKVQTERITCVEQFHEILHRERYVLNTNGAGRVDCFARTVIREKGEVSVIILKEVGRGSVNYRREIGWTLSQGLENTIFGYIPSSCPIQGLEVKMSEENIVMDESWMGMHDRDLTENFRLLQITETCNKWISLLDGTAETVTVTSVEQLKRVYQRMYQQGYDLKPEEIENGLRFAEMVIKENGRATLLVLTSSD